MHVSVSPPLKQLLEKTAAQSEAVELRDQAAEYSTQSSLPWFKIKSFVQDVRDQGLETQTLQELCRFEDVLYQGHSLASPRPPKQPSQELLVRRQQLQVQLDNMLYKGMVEDITVQERAAESMQNLLPTTRSQLSYGMHVLVIMFTLFMLGYMGSKMCFGSDELWAGLFGSLGLTLGLFVEVSLLIIRTNRPEKTPEDCSLIHQQNSRVQVEAGESGARSQGQSHVHPSSLDDERGEARNNVERIAEERARSGTEGRGTAEHLDEQVKLQT